MRRRATAAVEAVAMSASESVCMLNGVNCAHGNVLNAHDMIYYIAVGRESALIVLEHKCDRPLCGLLTVLYFLRNNSIILSGGGIG